MSFLQKPFADQILRLKHLAQRLDILPDRLLDRMLATAERDLARGRQPRLGSHSRRPCWPPRPGTLRHHLLEILSASAPAALSLEEISRRFHQRLPTHGYSDESLQRVLNDMSRHAPGVEQTTEGYRALARAVRSTSKPKSDRTESVEVRVRRFLSSVPEQAFSAEEIHDALAPLSPRPLQLGTLTTALYAETRAGRLYRPAPGMFQASPQETGA